MLNTRQLIAFSAIVIACSDSPTGNANPCANPDEGSFTGSASGAASGSLAGCALYAVTSSSGSAVLALALSSGSPTNPSLIVNLSRNGGRPATGTYSIGTSAGQFAGTVFLGFQNQTFSLNSGTITIDVSSDNPAMTAGTLGGTISVTGSATGGGGTISVSGNFTAVCSDGGSVTC